VNKNKPPLKKKNEKKKTPPEMKNCSLTLQEDKRMAKLLKRRTVVSVRMVLFPAESPSTGICYSTPMFVCPGFETGACYSSGGKT